MKVYSAVIERCPQPGLFVGYVPGFPGAHSQRDTLDEVHRNLHDVLAMLLEDGEPTLESAMPLGAAPRCRFIRIETLHQSCFVKLLKTSA